ncbi:MAG: hypothetical protein J0I20_18865 [Chloroflexi bacterium]|nr:hypothetical protein [Chloroflexota bacterium]
MIKRILMLSHLLLAAFLVKFLDADSDSGGSDSDSGGSDSGGSDSDSGGSSDGLSSSLETMEWSDSDSNSDSSNQSSQRKKPVPGAQDLLSTFSQEDLSQIPHRNDFPGPQ